MNFLKYCQQRILRNKVKKGFPLKNYDYDLNKIKEEFDEFEDAIKNDVSHSPEEAADIIIMVLGIIEQTNPEANMHKVILSKLKKNEKRKITKHSDVFYTKEEGV